MLPKLFKKKDPPKFLILELGLERVNCAVFKPGGEANIVGIGRKGFSSQDEIFNATLEALDSLTTIVDDIPQKIVIGVSDGKTQVFTTIAQYQRSKPKSTISDKETETALHQVVQNLEEDTKKVFFSTIPSAKVDGIRVKNPVGLKGQEIELHCFVALKPSEELDLINRIIEEMDVKVKALLPSGYSVFKLLEEEQFKHAIIFRIGKEKSELTLIIDGFVAEIYSVDLGVDSEFFHLSWQAALDYFKEDKPTIFWLYPDSYGVDLGKLKDDLENFDWESRGFSEKPAVKVVESVKGVAASDLPIYSLGVEASKTNI